MQTLYGDSTERNSATVGNKEERNRKSFVMKARQERIAFQNKKQFKGKEYLTLANRRKFCALRNKNQLKGEEYPKHPVKI